MTSDSYPRLGFRVLGNAMNRRRLVDAGAALAGYAACEPRAEVGREAYLSAFTFGEDFRRHLAETGSTRDYAGPCWAPWLWCDIDREGDLDAALRDARRLAAGILQRYPALNDGDLLLFFSGRKGAHVGSPVTWGPVPSATFHKTARRFCEALAAAAGVSIDTGIYDKVRLFRAPNSRHPKTGLHKRRLTFGELMGLSADRVQQMAREPETFDLPAAAACDPQAAADWRAAESVIASEAEANAQRRAAADGAPRLNRPTLDLLRGEVPGQGERHQRVFRAAANLAEFGCPPALAHALLTEPALDSGLPPADARRQIECGLAHGRKEAGDA